MAKITSTAKPTPVTFGSSWKIDLPVESYIQIYPRVSTPEQKKNVSAEMQVDKRFAMSCGWPEERIIVDDRDLGVSGQLRMEERLAFNEMNRKIADGQIKIVLAAQVDRLFRDRWGAEYAKFMEICYTYGVKVITLNHTRTDIDFIYDFSISWHVDQFRRKCEEAWKYIEGHVYRMLGAREEAAKAGRWTGHNMPIGYMPDLRERVDGKRNPNYKRWIAYQPHIERLDWIYNRFRQVGGGLHDLFREIHRQKDFFPPFEEWVPDVVLTHCRLLMSLFDDQEEVTIEQLRETGFTIQSPTGLRSILMNPFNAGMLVYKGVLLNAEDHDPATDLGAFLYAFNRLSPTNLDGTPNQSFLEKRRVYAKRFDSKTVAALYGKLEAAYPNYRVYLRDAPTNEETRKKANPDPEEVRKYYAFYDYGVEIRHLRYLIPVGEIDGCFFAHFVHALQEANDFEDYLEHEQEEVKQREKALARVERDILATQAAMERIEAQVENGELTNPNLARTANKQYTSLEQELARLESQKVEVEATTTRAQRRIGYNELMKRAGDRWSEIVKPEDLPEMVDTFVEKVVWEMLSPRFYTLTIQWRDPEWGADELLCFRDLHPITRWTEEDIALLREYYPTATAEELLQLFPDRTPMGIRKKARKLGIKSDTEKDWEGYRNDPERWSARWENRWTKEEDALLKEKYPTATADELLSLFPGRTPQSIRNRVYRLGIPCETPKRWKTFRRNCESILTPADHAVMQEYQITEEELRSPEVKLLRCSKAPSPTKARCTWPLSLSMRFVCRVRAAAPSSQLSAPSVRN
jgi:hypothetical protein